MSEKVDREDRVASGCASAIALALVLVVFPAVTGAAVFTAYGWARSHWEGLPPMPFGVALAFAWLWGGVTKRFK